MNALNLAAVALGAFYLSYAISSTHGPWKVFNFLRVYLPLGGLTSCIVCLSPWIAGALYLLTLVEPLAPLVYVFAAAGISVFMYRYTGGNAIQ